MPAPQQPAPAAPATDERALVAALQAGDAAAYERLVRDNAPRMMAVIRRYLRDEAEAADALQDAFTSAFRAMERFEGQSSLSTWLHRIAVNAALMRLRTRARRPEEPLDELLPAFRSDGHAVVPALAWNAPGLDAELGRRRHAARVRAAIDQLPETHRTVLLLRDLEELDTEETAAELGIQPGAVKTRLHRARQALRTLLDPMMREEA